jgi:hypothetical protein
MFKIDDIVIYERDETIPIFRRPNTTVRQEIVKSDPEPEANRKYIQIIGITLFLYSYGFEFKF